MMSLGVSVVTRLCAGQTRSQELNSQQGHGILLFATASRLAVGTTQPLVQWIPGVLPLGLKWPVNEADHSPLSSAKAKNAWSYISTSTYTWHVA